ncbi:cytochrome d ubiquinol oxidase subunit III [Escherichia coli]|uniref:Z-ring associated protein G n=5 Tax=Bacteria TaxID=2 RepID=A0A377C3R1_ECOLX|nr:cytochrome d ubiquinol oxidase subunit III [Escherichia coli]
MTWEYALIGLVVGIIIGAVAMRFGNRKLRQQQALQYELEKNKAELDEYREELVSHFARSAELLDTMAPRLSPAVSAHGKKLPAACCRNCLLKQTRSVIVWQSLKPATIRHRCRCLATILKGIRPAAYWREARLIYFFGRSHCALLFSPSRLSFNLVSHC